MNNLMLPSFFLIKIISAPHGETQPDEALLQQLMQLSLLLLELEWCHLIGCPRDRCDTWTNVDGELDLPSSW